MGKAIELPGQVRDNAGLVSTPVESMPPGCKGHHCPAFAICQGRCETRHARIPTVGSYPGGASAAT